MADEEAEAIFAERIMPLRIPAEISGLPSWYVQMGGMSLNALVIAWEPTSAFAEYCDYEVFVYDLSKEPLFHERILGHEFSNPTITSLEIPIAGIGRSNPRHIVVRVVPIREGKKREVTITGVKAY